MRQALPQTPRNREENHPPPFAMKYALIMENAKFLEKEIRESSFFFFLIVRVAL